MLLQHKFENTLPSRWSTHLATRKKGAVWNSRWSIYRLTIRLCCPPEYENVALHKKFTLLVTITLSMSKLILLGLYLWDFIVNWTMKSHKYEVSLYCLSGGWLYGKAVAYDLGIMVWFRVLHLQFLIRDLGPAIESIFIFRWSHLLCLTACIGLQK